LKTPNGNKNSATKTIYKKETQDSKTDKNERFVFFYIGKEKGKGNKILAPCGIMVW